MVKDLLDALHAPNMFVEGDALETTSTPTDEPEPDSCVAHAVLELAVELQQPQVQGPDLLHGDRVDEDVEADVNTA